MAKTLPVPTVVSKIERTWRVERETPRGGYRLRIHRETVTTLSDGTVAIVQQVDAYNEAATAVAGRAATRTYLGRCQAAKSPTDLIAAESQLYDDLVDEVRAEVAAAAAAEAKASADAAKAAAAQENG